MAIEVQVALVALVGTVFGVLVTLFTAVGVGITNSVKEANERFRSRRRLHEKYSDPLAASARDLMRRLDELVHQNGRDYYLQSRPNRTEFELLKWRSTLFRLAVLLAWIRALQRELFFLRADRRRPRKHQRALERAIEKLASALADGQHMEVLRVEAISEKLGILVPENSLHEVGQKVDFEIDRFMHERGQARLGALSKREQRQAASLAVSVVCRGRLTQNDVAYRWQDIIVALDAREAWIYRDWQSAIGDLMLVDAPEGPRKFDVIGYREFERVVESGTEEQRKWLSRLGSLVEDLDMSKPSTEDARVDSLRAAHRACGEIIVAVHKLEGLRSPVDGSLLQAAMKAKNLP